MKKLLAIVLALAMVLALVACGGNDAAQTPDDDAADNAPVENDGVEDAANDGAADDGAEVSSGAIKVGTSGPLNNDYAVYGVAVANGLELAFDEINALGGLQFETRAEDDEADVEPAVNAYNTLMDWGMQIMAGPTTSGSAAAAAAECAADRVFIADPLRIRCCSYHRR